MKNSLPQATESASIARRKRTDATGRTAIGTESRLSALQTKINANPATQRLANLQRIANSGAASEAPMIQRALDEEDMLQGKMIQREAKSAGAAGGLPDQLRAGIENLSGLSMDGVQVHRNSAAPAQVGAHAYAQGRDIHLAPGQEQHLPHEAWHVVQQAQGRVRPTMQTKGVAINDDAGLEREADVMGAKALQAQAQGLHSLRSILPYNAQTSAIPAMSSEDPTVTEPVAPRAKAINGTLDHTVDGLVQRMLNLNVIAELLTRNKNLLGLSEYQKDCVLYWNTRNAFDKYSGGELIDAILLWSTRGFEEKKDEAGRLAGQTNALRDLPEFMLEHHEFDLPLPLGIGTLSFRHGHQYVLGDDNNKWISNNVRWQGEAEGRKFNYMIHVILLFSGKSEGRWIVDPHVTIRNEFEQLKQTGVAFISEPTAKSAAKRENPEMEATRASYSLGLGTAKRKPGSMMGTLPSDYVDEIFVPWLLFVRDRAIRLNQVDPDGGIANRRLWMELKPQYAQKF